MCEPKRVPAWQKDPSPPSVSLMMAEQVGEDTHAYTHTANSALAWPICRSPSLRMWTFLPWWPLSRGDHYCRHESPGWAIKLRQSLPVQVKGVRPH